MSTLHANTVETSSGGPVTLTQQNAAKAWISFTGTGTVAIRSALNMSSVTDNGTGDYTLNFTNAMADANYSFALCHHYLTATIDSGISVQARGGSASVTTTSIRIACMYSNTAYDVEIGSGNLHGDLS